MHAQGATHTQVQSKPAFGLGAFGQVPPSTLFGNPGGFGMLGTTALAPAHGFGVPPQASMPGSTSLNQATPGSNAFGQQAVAPSAGFGQQTQVNPLDARQQPQANLFGLTPQPQADSTGFGQQPSAGQHAKPITKIVFGQAVRQGAGMTAPQQQGPPAPGHPFFGEWSYHCVVRMSAVLRQLSHGFEATTPCMCQADQGCFCVGFSLVFTCVQAG